MNSIDAQLQLFADDLFYAPTDLTAAQALDNLQKASSTAQAQKLAAAYAKKNAVRTPCVFSSTESALRPLFNHSELLTPEFLSALTNTFSKAIKNKELKARSIITLTNKNRSGKKHNYRLINSLEGLANEMLSDGVYLLSAPHGCGKTELVGIPFSLAASGLMTACCPLRSLTADVATRFNASHYESARDELADIISKGNLEHEFAAASYQIKNNRLAICLPSFVLMLKYHVQETDTLIIDEIAQALMLALSDVVENNENVKSARLVEQLRAVIKSARRVLVMDADLDDQVVAFLEECRPNERFNIFEMPRDDKGYVVRWNCCEQKHLQARAETAILSAIKSGQRCIVATDSCGFSTGLGVLIEQSAPDAKVLVIDGNTSARKEVKAFLAAPNLCAHLYDIVIHSPTMKSGVSITQGCFDLGFAVFSGLPIGAPDALQMMRRDRKLTEWQVFLPTYTSKPAPISAKANLDARENCAELIQANATGDNAAQAELYDRFKFRMQEKQADAAYDFPNKLFFMLEAYQFKIERVTQVTDAPDSMVREINKELAQEHMLAVLAAPMPSDFERMTLEEKEELTFSEKAQRDKARICDALKLDDITEGDFELYNDGRIIKPLTLLERISAGEIAEFLDKDSGKHIADKCYDFAVAQSLQEIITLSGLKLENGSLSGRIMPENEQAIFSLMAKRKRMFACFGIISSTFASDKSKITCAKKAIKHAFERLGVEFKSASIRSGSRADDKKIRVLEVDADKNSLLFGAVDRRLAERAAAKRAAQAMADRAAANADSLEIDISESMHQPAAASFERVELSADERRANAQAVLDAYEFTDNAAKSYTDDYLLRAAVRLSSSKHIFDVRAYLIEHDQFNDERFDSALYRLRLEDIEAFDPVSGLFDEAI